jgi:DNA-binding PadR family transcriptional regulator
MKNRKLPKISIELLKEISTPKSFRRGRDYYENELVADIKVFESSYVAIVKGSYDYEVKIYTEGNATIFSCSCPYDWGGVCKHCIAVGLYILNENVEFKTDNIEEKSAKANNFDISKAWDRANLEQKEKFLKQVLLNDESYREKFFAYILPQTELETKLSANSIRDQVIEILENFDLENYYRFYDGYERSSGYRDEWEQLFDGVEYELKNKLNDITSAIRRNLTNGNLIDAVKILFGFYEGCFLADCSEINDPACIFDGEFKNTVISYFLDFYSKIISIFPENKLTTAAAIRIMEIFFQREELYESKEEFNYCLPLWRNLLKILIIDEKTAKTMLTFLTKKGFLDYSTDIVQLKIYEITNSQHKWLTAAKKYYDNNTTIAQELLEFYDKTDRKKFIDLAKKVFKGSPDSFDEYLYENLGIDDDRELYRNILFNLAKRTRNLELFRELKANFGNNSAQKFIAEASNDTFFYLDLLQEVKDYEKILQLVKENNYHWGFHKFITPILNIYPKESFEIIKNKANICLEERMGRRYYIEVASWLQLLLKIEDKNITSEIKIYLQELLQKYKRRPALIDELKKVGIK